MNDFDLSSLKFSESSFETELRLKFGKRLREIRLSKEMSQDEMAKMLKTTKQVLSNYETGKRAPTIITAIAYAKALGMSIGELVGVEPDEADVSRQSTIIPVASFNRIKIIGAIKCGPNGMAYEDIEGYADAANLKNPDDYFYLRVFGDSMEPRIVANDLALVHKQEDVESGELAAVLIDGEEGTLKRVIKQDDSVVLQAFNPAYSPRVFTREQMNQIRIMGKVVKTEAQW